MIITGVLDIIPVVDGEDAVSYEIRATPTTLNTNAARTQEVTCTVNIYKKKGTGSPVLMNSGYVSVTGYDKSMTSLGSVTTKTLSPSSYTVTFLSSALNNTVYYFRVQYLTSSGGTLLAEVFVPVVLGGPRDRFRGYWNADDNYEDSEEVKDNVVLQLPNNQEQAYERKGGGTVTGSAYKPNTTQGATKWRAVETNPKTYFKTVLAALIAAQEGDFDSLHALHCVFGDVKVSGEVNASSGKIGGYHIVNGSLQTESDDIDASLWIGANNDLQHLFFGRNRYSGQAIAEIVNEVPDNLALSMNTALSIAAKGASYNVALRMLAGCVQGFAMYNTVVGSGNASFARLTRNAYNVIVLTFNHQSDFTLYLPSMELYDDGHVIRIKRLGNDGRVNIVAVDCKTSYGTGIPYFHKDRGDILEGDSGQYNLAAAGDSIELVWIRDLSSSINGITHYGCWMEYKLPRDW